jgi:hypothetical protein
MPCGKNVRKYAFFDYRSVGEVWQEEGRDFPVVRMEI